MNKNGAARTPLCSKLLQFGHTFAPMLVAAIAEIGSEWLPDLGSNQGPAD
jgi:hypothetical protein